MISDVGRHITSILDVDELLAEIARDIQKAFDYDVISISLVEGDELVIKASAPHAWQDLAIPPLRVKVGGEGVIGWVAGTGEPALVPDVRREPRFINWPEGILTRSELAVPLKVQSGVLGVLNAESARPHAFDEGDLHVLQTLASQAAIAVENARLYADARRPGGTAHRAARHQSAPSRARSISTSCSI